MTEPQAPEPDVLLELAERIYPILLNFPDDGQLQRHVDDLDAALQLHLAGFVARREITKRCKCCGTEKFDHAYWRITGGGRLFMAAMGRSRAKD